MGRSPLFQKLKSPMTLMYRALGAQTRKTQPSTPSRTALWQPSSSKARMQSPR